MDRGNFQIIPGSFYYSCHREPVRDRSLFRARGRAGANRGRVKVFLQGKMDST